MRHAQCGMLSSNEWSTAMLILLPMPETQSIQGYLLVRVIFYFYQIDYWGSIHRNNYFGVIINNYGVI